MSNRVWKLLVALIVASALVSPAIVGARQHLCCGFDYGDGSCALDYATPCGQCSASFPDCCLAPGYCGI